jgi:predicted amidohydrolase
MTKISCAQYQIEKLSNWNDYAKKIEALVQQAKEKHSDLLLLPEYSGIEVACQYFSTDKELFEALQPNIQNYIQFFQTLAKQYQIYLQPGTIVEKVESNQFANRAYFFSPDGTFDYQDKLQLIEYEKSGQLIQPGKQHKIFETALGKIGIVICYDSEFPEITRELISKGAEIILVPSYTTTLAGLNRVFLSCRARAIENQCYVAVSFVVGHVDMSDTTDTTFGQAAIFSPADIGFPDDGIIAQGKLNQTMLVTGEIDLTKIKYVRQNGHVHNFADSKHYLAQYLK